MANNSELIQRFTYMPADTPEIQLAHDGIRQQFRTLVKKLESQLPTDSRETALVWTKLEEAMQWANKAIAIQGAMGGSNDTSGEVRTTNVTGTGGRQTRTKQQSSTTPTGRQRGARRASAMAGS